MNFSKSRRNLSHLLFFFFFLYYPETVGGIQKLEANAQQLC